MLRKKNVAFAKKEIKEQNTKDHLTKYHKFIYFSCTTGIYMSFFKYCLYNKIVCKGEK